MQIYGVNIVENLILDPFNFENPKIKMRIALCVLSGVESFQETVCTLSNPSEGVTLDADMVDGKHGRHQLQLILQ